MHIRNAGKKKMNIGAILSMFIPFLPYVQQLSRTPDFK